MEANDTIMSSDERMETLTRWNDLLGADLRAELPRKWITVLLGKQVEITGKTMEQEGIKKVVEWIKSHSVKVSHYPPFIATVRWVLESEWKAQLKEWGIE